MDIYLLSALIIFPLIGALFILFFVRKENNDHNAKLTALWTSAVNFVISLYILFKFDASNAEYQFVEKVSWFDGANIFYYLGIDGISIYLVLLTTLLIPICIITSWNTIKHRVRDYMIAFLVLESLVIGAFCALDALLFYIFFEAVLIPMYFIIGIWGGQNRIYAAFKFFLFTLLGSILFLVALLYLYFTFGTFEIPVLMKQSATLPLSIQQYLWLAMFASFAVKMPMWPVHTWLPDAHVQAPTAGSVILAGVLLKIGGYGFLRFSLPMLPDASIYFTPLIYGLSVIAIVYTSLVALVQKDMKKLIAYSSVAHMGIVTIGLFTLNNQGLEGAIIQMLSHGLISGALFLCVGVVYDRLHTKEIERYGGVVSVMPRYAVLFLFFTMASVGLPGTSGFIGEFLVIIGVYKASGWIALFAASGMILGAAYALWLYRRIIFGELTKGDVKKMVDLNRTELSILSVLAILVLLVGIYPNIINNYVSPSVNNLLLHMEQNSTASIATMYQGN